MTALILEMYFVAATRLQVIAKCVLHNCRCPPMQVRSVKCVR